MLRLRCPHHGCSIEVASDKAGEWIRCPQCQQLVIVDPQQHRAADVQVQPSIPDIALDPGPKRGGGEPGKLENRLYAGLPPLAIMMGVRKGRGGNWKDDRAVRDQMTEADWKALAAFEKAARATASLKMTFVHGVAVALITVLLWRAAASSAANEGLFFARHWAGWLATLVFLAAGFVLIVAGWRRLDRLKIGALVETAIWAALGVALIFVVQAVRNLLALGSASTDQPPFGFALLAIPFQLFATISACATSLAVYRAQKQVSPPEILHPLTEALEYLYSVRD